LVLLVRKNGIPPIILPSASVEGKPKLQQHGGAAAGDEEEEWRRDRRDSLVPPEAEQLRFKEEK
jgi:hypothetical protein